MDWSMDPAKVADIRDVIAARRFSARDAEKFTLAITGGGENVDLPLWDMLQTLFALGVLAAGPRLGPRDAAIACLLDETGAFLRPLRSGKTVSVAGAEASSSSAGVALTIAGGERRDFAWSRVARALGLADFLFASDAPELGGDSGLLALGRGLDEIFSGDRVDDALMRRAVSGPARFMRLWRKAHLPLAAFAELIRCRESYLAAVGRRDRRRELDADDAVALWTFALRRGETWSFARYLEKLAALTREERMGVARRSFLAPASIDDLAGREPGHDPESAIVELIDRRRSGLALGVEDEAPGETFGAWDDDALDEPTMAALMSLPSEPKLLTKEERETAARTLALLPLAHEQPLSLVRSVVVGPWENRLVEATRRSAGAIGVEAGTFDYASAGEGAGKLERRFDELLLIAAALAPGDRSGGAEIAAEGAKTLKRWRHDRASFRIDDAKLAQSFASFERDLKTVFAALQRIARQNRRFVDGGEATAKAVADRSLFGEVFSWRYKGLMERR